MYATRTPESLETGLLDYTLERGLTEAELTQFCSKGWEQFIQYEPHSLEMMFDEGSHIDEAAEVLNWLYSL